MKILGIDPGLTGAIAATDTRAGTLEIHDMPTMLHGVARTARQVIDEGTVLALFQLYAGMGYRDAVLESVGGLPGQSAPAAFNFGRGYGVLRMGLTAAGIALHPAAPATWKQHMRVPKDKKAARQRASELLPTHAHLWPLVKHDGRAEAALLALYGERTLRGRA